MVRLRVHVMLVLTYGRKRRLPLHVNISDSKKVYFSVCPRENIWSFAGSGFLNLVRT